MNLIFNKIKHFIDSVADIFNADYSIFQEGRNHKKS